MLKVTVHKFDDTIVFRAPAESSSGNAIFCATRFSVIRLLRLLC